MRITQMRTLRSRISNSKLFHQASIHQNSFQTYLHCLIYQVHSHCWEWLVPGLFSHCIVVHRASIRTIHIGPSGTCRWLLGIYEPGPVKTISASALNGNHKWTHTIHSSIVYMQLLDKVEWWPGKLDIHVLTVDWVMVVVRDEDAKGLWSFWVHLFQMSWLVPIDGVARQVKVVDRCRLV